MSKLIMKELAHLGQSIWLDNINRTMIASGKLQSLIEHGLRGQTSNPSIFKQAIAASSDYDKRIQELNEQAKNTFEIYDDLTIADVAAAADLFKGLWEKTGGLDGYVSLEINPKLGNEFETQLNEGLRLWKKLNRPNVMIKVPSTKNGCEVVEALIAEGVNVNATLIFSAEQYQQVAWAYINGLKKFALKGGDIFKVRSVASVFVSRIDTTVDKWIDEQLAKTMDNMRKAQLSSLRGIAAVANSEIIFHKFHKTFESDDFKALAAKGAHIQRVLWASTGTKDSKYSDIKYITELIGKDTVNTVPDKTLDAYLDHGQAKLALPNDVARAQRNVEQLRALGIDVGVVCLKLLDEGLKAFEAAFDELMDSIEEKSRRLCSTK